MKYPWLYVGAKVVCVNTAPVVSSGCAPMRAEGAPTKDAVYTVTEVFEDRHRASLHVRLAEIRNIGHTAGVWGDIGYDVRRFRPILPDTTKQVEALKQAMRDHVANASGGLGIRKARA